MDIMRMIVLLVHGVLVSCIRLTCSINLLIGFCVCGYVFVVPFNGRPKSKTFHGEVRGMCSVQGAGWLVLD
jgi:hypothetical protein